MKIMRYFPLIALAILGFILYGLFKASSFVNKKVDAKVLSSQDSIIKNAPNQEVTASANSILADTLATPVTGIATPATGTATSATNLATPTESTSPPKSATKPQESPVKKDPASAEHVSAASKPASLALNAPTPVPKRAKKTPAKTSVAVESGKATPTEPAKAEPKKAIEKTPVPKGTPSTSSTAIVSKGDVPKSASVVVKKETTEGSYHVVIGSYAQEANAKSRAATFEQKNKKKATIIKQGGYFRVCADEFEFPQAASQYAQKLKEAGEESLILKF